MLKKIYQELMMIRKELQAIRSSKEFNLDPVHLYEAIQRAQEVCAEETIDFLLPRKEEVV